MAALNLHLFGPFEAVSDNAPLGGFRADKVRALLAYLAVEGGRSHSRETLRTLLWGEHAETSARASLRSALYNLRQLLAPLAAAGTGLPLLIVTRQSVSFRVDHPDCGVDVAEFDALWAACQSHPHQDLVHCATCVRRMARMVELYRGDLLTGFTLPDSPAFDEWRLLQQEARHRQVLEAAGALTAHHSALGDYDQAARYARRQIELAPWQEAAHRQLMWSLAMSGQRSAALVQYETCRRVLRQELDVEPDASTTTLDRQIRGGELGWDASAGGEPANPYKGLQPFREADVQDFFGREALVERLLERLGGEPGEEAWMAHFLVLVGPSGSGKSSVVRAGLIPALRRAAQWGTERWHIATLFPGANPLAELAAALDEALPPPLPLPQAEGREAGGDGEDLSRTLTARLPEGDHLLLVVDQAEELFTLTQDREERARFMAGLLAAARAPGSRLHVVLTLRADHYAYPLQSAEAARLFTRRVEFTLPLSPEELQRAIVRPAHRVGVRLEPELVSTLVAGADREPGALPLLQYALTELFERRAGRLMTLGAYRALGGLTGALVGRVDELYAGLSDLEQAAAQQLFLRLVVLAEEVIVARRRVPRAELFSLASSHWGGQTPLAGTQDERRQALETVLQLFGQHRLLTFDRDPVSGAATVEIAHEALIAAWDRLGDWIRASRQELRLRRRFRALARVWEQSARDASFLARGRQLDQFAEWAATTDLALADVELAYLSASLAESEAQRARQAALERRSRNRLRALAAVLAVAAVVALALSAFAFRQQQVAQREAAIAQSLNLSTSAQLALSEHETDLALALALAANHVPDPPPQAEYILAEAAYSPGVRHVFAGHDGPVQSVAVSPDGQTILSASSDQTLVLWDLGGGQIIRRFAGHTGAVHSAVFVPGGDRILSGADDGTLILWDVASGAIVRRFTGHSGGVWEVAAHPSLPQAISASADGTLILWDLESGQALRRFVGHEGQVTCVAIHHEGKLALSGSTDRSLRLWDIETGEMVHHMAGHAESIADPSLREGHSDAVWSVAFSRNSRTAVSVSEDEFMMQWNIDTGELIRWHQPPRAAMLSLAISPDDAGTLVGTQDGRLALSTIYFGQTVLQLYGHSGRVLDVAFTPDSQFAVGGSEDGTVRLWALNSGAQLRRFVVDPYSAIEISLSADGSRALSASFAGYVTLWDVETGQILNRFTGHAEMAYAGALLLPDGQTALSGGGSIRGASEDPILRLWDTETGEEIRRFEGHTDFLWDVALAPDGRVAVSGSNDGTVRRWDLASGEPAVLLDLGPQNVRGVAVSPDGRLVLVGPGDGTSSDPDYSLRLLELETGAELQRFAGHEGPTRALAFSPDGRTALSGSFDRTLVLWDVESGQALKRLTGHAANLTVLTYNADGRWALSADLNGVMILWDLESGTPLRRYTGHMSGVLGLAFTPGERTFLSVSFDSTVREWRIDATSGDLLAWAAENRDAPELTCEQRRQYLVEPLCE